MIATQHPLLAAKNHTVPLPGMWSSEAAGAAAGRAQDASAGLGLFTDGSGRVWAWNPAMGEWQRLHTIASGDSLWKLTKIYYGAYSQSGVHAIHDVPQNEAIQGPDAGIGLIPGDVILIPGLPQPTPPEANSDSSPLSVPQRVGGCDTLGPEYPGTWVYDAAQGTCVPESPSPTAPGGGMPATVEATAPADWPANLPYPPIQATGGTVVVPTDTSAPMGDAVLVELPEMEVVGTPPPKFWTPGRIAIVALLGTAGLGTVGYLVFRKPRRRNPRRRAA